MPGFLAERKATESDVSPCVCIKEDSVEQPDKCLASQIANQEALLAVLSVEDQEVMVRVALGVHTKTDSGDTMYILAINNGAVICATDTVNDYALCVLNGKNQYAIMYVEGCYRPVYSVYRSITRHTRKDTHTRMPPFLQGKLQVWRWIVHYQCYSRYRT